MSDRRSAPMAGTTVLSASNAAGGAADLHLHLYVAGNTLHTQRARKNLDEIVSQLRRPVDASETDVFIDPSIALMQQIFITPSLVATCRGRRILIVGDLSNRQAAMEQLSVFADAR